MIKRFKYDFRYLHVFVIMFKQTDNRMTSAMWNMLKVFERMFGPSSGAMPSWKQLIGVTANPRL